MNMDLSRTVDTTAIKLKGMIVSPVHNQRQTNCNCTVRQTHSLLSPSLQQEPLLQGKTAQCV